MDTTSQTSLTRLLTKLDHSLLDPTSADPRLRHSQYERNRVSANIEYARTLLLTLEKQSATVRAQTQRQLTQADLQWKREVIKRLQARLQELNQLDEADNDEEESDDDEDGEDVEGEGGVLAYAPARKDTEAGLDTGDPQGPRVDAPQAQEIRNRRPLSASDNLTAASSTAREQLFTGRNKESEPSMSGLNRTEALISHNRTEQETLTTGLIGLARALKESSLQFSSSLEAEKDVLKRAEGGLDKSSQGMEAAEQRMGMLRRMSEGQGWWGRIKLYAFIFGLWIACFLLVFIGPKLRF
ncbi:hypothetical protein B0A55_01038 [Friedmanniomyces simplex]|uniref:Synaptobrevin n=1 Tax=Friedmanniomyces simplex TaxID=329884 RepID=A0A4U0Y3I9_9PEZI|nr:hypothetical protein B0A55_01038 [Friedmanniomyces simplex]